MPLPITRTLSTLLQRRPANSPLATRNAGTRPNRTAASNIVSTSPSQRRAIDPHTAQKRQRNRALMRQPPHTAYASPSPNTAPAPTAPGSPSPSVAPAGRVPHPTHSATQTPSPASPPAPVNRFARFTHTISRIIPTAHHNTISDRRNRPAHMFFQTGTSGQNNPSRTPDASSRITWDQSSPHSACAFPIVTPGLNRPMIVSVFPQSRISSITAGTNMSIFIPGSKNRAKIKSPATHPPRSPAVSFSVIACPTIERSPPNCRLQYACSAPPRGAP